MSEMRKASMYSLLWVCVLLSLSAATVFGGIADMVEAVAESDFELKDKERNLPRRPIAWLNATHYGETEFVSERDDLDGVSFEQLAISQGLLLPVWVEDDDMIVLGYSLGTSHFSFENTGRDSGDLHSLGVFGCWLRQINPEWLTGVFAAPFIHSGLSGGSPWESEWYAGAIASYEQTDTLQWLMGGIYQQGFDTYSVYPYAGLIWRPHPDWSVNATLPWPSVNYAITHDWALRFGAKPSGGQWMAENDESITRDFGGWDLGLTTEFRISGSLWGMASVGYTGLHAFGVEEDGETVNQGRLDSDPFVRLGLTVRL